MSTVKEYGFFGSKNGDRKYNSDDFSAFFADFFTNGVLADSTENLQVVSGDGMTLTVKKGIAYIDGHFFRPMANKSITLAESDIEYPRYDLVVLRCDYINRMVYLDVIMGEPSENPIKPEIQRDASIYDLGLAAVYVEANASVISQINIEDLRFNNDYCGVVTGVIKQIGTTELFAQYQAAWNAFVEQLGESDKVTINTEDVYGRKLTDSVRMQQSFGSMFTMI